MTGKSNAEQEFTAESTERTEKGLAVKPLAHFASLVEAARDKQGKGAEILENKERIMWGVPTPGVLCKECGRI